MLDWNFIAGLIATVAFDIIYFGAIIGTITVIILDNRNPVKTMAWILVLMFLPVVGLVFYFFFGRSQRRVRVIGKKSYNRLLKKPMAEYLAQDSCALPANYGRLISLFRNTNQAFPFDGNRVEVYTRGLSMIQSLLRELQKATRHIHMEFYIFEDDAVGRMVRDVLMEKAKQGVEVRVIYDDVGCWHVPNRFYEQMREAGVEVRSFLKVRFPLFTSNVNYRNHRKILVVDGRVGFTGGINIAQRYVTGTKLGPWRDTHLRLEGEAVGMLQIVFITDWFFVTKKLLADYDKYLPKTHVRDETMIQIVTSGPDSDWASIMQAFFSAISHAQHHIYISSPYFLPNEAILTAVKVASLSGIDVRIMIPSRSDSKIVYWASRSYIGELIEANVKVYLYRKGFNHSKLIMIDGRFASVGTANMDIRSFEDNFEVSAILYDRAITESLEADFLRDLERSRLVTREYWESRPLLHNMYEAMSRLFSPLL